MKISDQVAIQLIQLYQRWVRPLFQGIQLSITGTKPRCVFFERGELSCSQFTIEAIRQHGIIKGCWRGLKRVCSCHS